MNTIPRILVTVCALVLFLSCGGGSDSVLNGPGSIDPSGEWSISYALTMDTCNSGFVNETLDVELTLSNDGTILYWQDEGEPCNGFPFPWSGQAQQTFYETEDFWGSDGCQYHDDVTVTYTWSNDTHTAEIVYLRTILAGNNCTNHPAPCEIRESVQGTRCNGCYDGCI